MLAVVLIIVVGVIVAAVLTGIFGPQHDVVIIDDGYDEVIIIDEE